MEANAENGPGEPKDSEIVEANAENGPDEPNDGQRVFKIYFFSKLNYILYHHLIYCFVSF